MGVIIFFPSRNLSSIIRIICKKYNILRVIAPTTCEHHVNVFRMHALGVGHTYEEITEIIRIVDASAIQWIDLDSLCQSDEAQVSQVHEN